MAAIWDPQMLFDAFPDSHSFTCIGTTKKGARCRQFMFSSADRSEASRILETISFLRPKSRRVYDVLPDLAYLMLCPRWHRKPGYSQETKMVQKWQTMIEDYCASTTRTRTTRTSGPSSRITRSSSDHAHTMSTSLPSPPTLNEHSELSVPRRSTNSPSRRTGLSTPPASPRRSPVPSISTEPDIPTSNPSLDLATPPTTPARQNNTSTVPSPRANAQSSRSRRQNSATSAESPESTTPTPSVPVPSPCPSSKHSARRKPITENCGICYESICCPEDAVWCRAQCGQNVHRTCFGKWRKHCLIRAANRGPTAGDDQGLEPERMLEVVKCTYCRAKWRWEWED